MGIQFSDGGKDLFLPLMRWKLLGLFLMLVVGCVSSVRNSMAELHSVEIHLKHVSIDEWQADYRLSSPTKQIVFWGDISSFRGKVFRFVDPAFELSQMNDKEIVVRKDGAAFRNFSLKFNPRVVSKDESYPFMLAFTDGSVAIHLGYLGVFSASAQSQNVVYTFETLAEENLLVNGVPSRSWSPENEFDGVYAYFGSIRPKIGEKLKILFDPQTPAWLSKLSEKALPEIFGFFESEFQQRPNIFFILNASDMRNLETSNLRASAYPGWILTRISGASWKEPSEEFKSRFLSLAAHEGAHRFQGLPVGDFLQRAWLMEGAAEFFKDQALSKLGYQSHRQLMAELSSAANKCVNILEQNRMTLQSPSEGEGYYGTYYCGHVLHYATHIASMSRLPGGMFGLWRKLLQHAAGRNGSIDENDYFKILRDLSVTPEYIAVAQKFISTQHSDPRGAIDEVLRSGGVKFKLRRPKGKIENGPQFQFL